MGISTVETEQVDVLIIGAGLSGIGAASQLAIHCPQKSYAVLEMRGAIGGTWDLFRYPGVRSDSDMFTFGYSFKPWIGDKVLADGDSIRDYVRETAREYGVEERLRFHHRVRDLSWSSDEGCWTATGERTDTGEQFAIKANFVVNGTGYYSYDEGYVPEFEGVEQFGGEIVYPQFWPQDLDWAGKRVVVIGSGATAVTVVPAMAGSAEHVTMLQRSPSYVLSLPLADPVARILRRLRVPEAAVHRITRAKNVVVMLGIFRASRRWPNLVRRVLRRSVRRRLPADYDVDRHFKPAYDPWDQRLCFVPDGDLFKAISSGEASVVTDRIRQFTGSGMVLESGRTLDADIVVMATGLKLLPLGGISVSVDERQVEIAATVLYKAMMMSGVPNLAWIIGYTNISWTLRCNLTARYVCRLLNHMEANGYAYCVPELGDESLELDRAIDLNAGYVLRGIDSFPKQGTVAPWRASMFYPRDVLEVGRAELDDGTLRFFPAPIPAETVPAEPAVA